MIIVSLQQTILVRARLTILSLISSIKLLYDVHVHVMNQLIQQSNYYFMYLQILQNLMQPNLVNQVGPAYLLMTYILNIEDHLDTVSKVLDQQVTNHQYSFNKQYKNLVWHQFFFKNENEYGFDYIKYKRRLYISSPQKQSFLLNLNKNTFEIHTVKLRLLYFCNKDMLPDIHTIIVGSGIAGTAAAAQLAKSGNRVLILEANNYIGGRTKTTPIKLANQAIFPFEQGANWIHGSSKKHPITKLSKQMGNVKLVCTNDDSIISYDEEGQEVDRQVQKQYNQYENLLEKAQEFQNMSVYEAIKKINPKKLSNKFFMFNISYDLQFETASSIQNLSAEHGQQDSSFNGKQMLVLNGYQAFPQYLAHHQNIKVLINHQVREVTFNGSINIVKCSNGSAFQAPNIIIGVPIGILKSKNIRFIPQLPPWKEEAIQKIQFGNVCKILIILKNKKIDIKYHYISVISDNIENRGCATLFLNLQVLAGIPALMTFGIGPSADQLEFMPQKQLKEIIAKRLRVFANESFSSNDFNIVRSSWKGNQHFRGTYSYSGIQTKSKHWQNMAKPLFERNMFFCGEHTHSKYRGTVHGAYLSGVNAVQCIINNINKKWKYQGKQESDSSESEKQENYHKKQDKKRPRNKKKRGSSPDQ